MPNEPRGAAPAMALALSLLMGTCALGAAAPGPSAGERLYQRGQLPSGEPVQALRQGGATVRGADAACVNCHRRSGLGSSEGKITIPPVAGPYLFTPRGKSLERLGVPYVDTARINHEAYTEESLARAIRDGVDAKGRLLNSLMPRYAIDEATMSSLIEYLKDLKTAPAPGATSTVLHFATIITPDADPVKRRGVLAVMNQYFVDKNNAAARTKAPTLYSSHATMFRVERRWQLHVWELTGAPRTWETQLRAHLAAEPVFAVISGLGGSDWGPVERFCEEQGLPCLFPNVEAPVGDDATFYTVYFSRGVLLEAQLIARELAAAGGGGRVVQVFRAGDVGEAAARALEVARAGSGQQVVNHALKAHGPPQELARALREASAADALVLWLRPADLRPSRATRGAHRLRVELVPHAQGAAAGRAGAGGHLSRPGAHVGDVEPHGGRVRARLPDRAHRDGARSPGPHRLLPAPESRARTALRLQGRLHRALHGSAGLEGDAARGVDHAVSSGRIAAQGRRGGFLVGVSGAPDPIPGHSPRRVASILCCITRCRVCVSLRSS